MRHAEIAGGPDQPHLAVLDGRAVEGDEAVGDARGDAAAGRREHQHVGAAVDGAGGERAGADDGAAGEVDGEGSA